MKRPADNPILICSSSAPPLKSGAGTNAHNFGLHLQKYGFSVKHFSFNWNMSFPNVSKESGLKIIRAPYFKYNKISRALSAFFTIPVMLICAFAARTIFIYGPVKGYLLLILLGKVSGKQVVFRSTMLGDDDIYSLIHKYPAFKGFRKWALSNLSAYYSLNPGFTASYEKVYGDIIKVIQCPQGLDILKFNAVSDEEKIQLRIKLGLPLDVPVFVSVGYLIRRKGYAELFENLAKLQTDFRYVIIGDFRVGPEHSLYSRNFEMSELYEKGMGLFKNKVIFTGPLKNVSDYLRSADVFLLNSDKEGVPNVLLEAMACGCVPLIKEIEGLNGFITFPENNALVYNNVAELPILMNRLLTDKQLKKKLAENSVAFAKQNLDFNKVAEKVMNKLGINLTVQN